MKGVSFRRPPPGHPSLYIRIVSDMDDSTRDRFIPIETAQDMLSLGKLVEVNVGKEYPNSFMYIY